MSSFNYLSPNKRKSSFGPCAPSTSTLNPTASSYIPLNAVAVPYIPFTPEINICKSHPPPKKTLCPSFLYYDQMKSSQMYNATHKYHGNQFDDISSLCSSSNESSETQKTPIPASVASSVCSEFECNAFDLNNIEPYIPNNRHNIDDIDDINDIQHTKNKNKQNLNISIIPETSDCESLHPAIAALSAKEYKALLDAPVWSPDNHQNKHFSKIAIDEEDYQLIIHPNKKPIKYGLHIKHETGESYDEYAQMLTDATSTYNNIAPVASASMCTSYDGNKTNNLYKSKQSKIAVEGYPDEDATKYMTNELHPRTSKIALDIKPVTAPSTMLCYGESYVARIASPLMQHVSYIHCIV